LYKTYVISNVLLFSPRQAFKDKFLIPYKGTGPVNVCEDEVSLTVWDSTNSVL
jgi:hypothetical protein